jgi:hypothetical protein
MKLTKLSAAPDLAPQAALRTEVPPHARARYSMDAGTASQLIPGVGPTSEGNVDYAVPGLLVILLIEILLTSRWWPPYFTRGLVVYRRSLALTGSVGSFPSVDSLAQRFRGTFGPSLVFAQLSPGLLAFREKVFEFRLVSYTPVMHGLLRLRLESSHLDVEGRANWSPIAFSVAMLIFLRDFPDAWPMLGFLLAFLGGVGALQANQYAKVAAFVAEGLGGMNAADRADHASRF